MPIPEQADFEEILSKLALMRTPPGEGTSSIELPTCPAVDQTGEVALNAHWLTYPSDTRISFEALCRRVESDLTKSGHLAHRSFTLFVLAFGCLFERRNRSAVSVVNAILQSVCDGDVNLYCLLFAKLPGEFGYEVPPFKIGRLEAHKLKYQCEKAGSDYYSRYKERLANVWSVTRSAKRVRIIDFQSASNLISEKPIFGSAPEPLRYKTQDWLLYDYFSALNQLLFQEFWGELISVQDPIVALGGPFFNIRTFQSLMQHEQVAVFLNVGRRGFGFVAPNGTGPSELNFVNAHERVPRLLRELKEEYSFEAFDATPLHGSMKTFSSFVASARRHEVDGRMSEAFVHLITALELIFGERFAIQKSVTERVAVLTFFGRGCSFVEQKSRLEDLYRVRSVYVHTGAAVEDPALLADLFSLCENVFRCLLRLQASCRATSERGEERLKNWLLYLDFLAAGLRAGVGFAEEDYKLAFVL